MRRRIRSGMDSGIAGWVSGRRVPPGVESARQSSGGVHGRGEWWPARRGGRVHDIAKALEVHYARTAVRHFLELSLGCGLGPVVHEGKRGSRTIRLLGSRFRDGLIVLLLCLVCVSVHIVLQLSKFPPCRRLPILHRGRAAFQSGRLAPVPLSAAPRRRTGTMQRTQELKHARGRHRVLGSFSFWACEFFSDWEVSGAGGI